MRQHKLLKIIKQQIPCNGYKIFEGYEEENEKRHKKNGMSPAAVTKIC